MADAALRHVMSALARLSDGGRLVAITGSNFAHDNPSWTEAFVQLQERGRVVFYAAADGAVAIPRPTRSVATLKMLEGMNYIDSVVWLFTCALRNASSPSS